MAVESSPVHQLYDVAEGLNYLHSRNVVHGNIKGGVATHYTPSYKNNLIGHVQTNILVEQSGRARVTDFSLATINHSRCSTCGVAKIYNDTRWTAPEVLEQTRPLTKEADVFSFAMVVVEVSRGARHAVTSS